MFGLKSELNLGWLDGVRDRAVKELDAAVRATAFAVEGSAKQGAPVDTGALRASIYTVTSQGSGGGKAAAVASARRPDQAFDSGGEVKPLTALVVVGAQYGVHLEYGTVHMPAQPYLYPALAAHRETLSREVAAAVRRIGRG